MKNAEAVADRWYKLKEVQQSGDADGCWSLKWRRLDSYALFVVTGGDGIIAVDTRMHVFHPQMVMFCRPGQGVWIEADLLREGHVYQLYFDMEERADDCAAFGGELRVALTGADIALCAAIYRDWYGENRIARLRSQSAFCELLYSIASRCNEEELAGLKGDLARAKLYMERHYADDITIEQLAESVRVSARHFRRLFKETYKLSATEYVTELRINRAKQLMTGTCGPIADIAQQVGYQNESHFRRMFKQQAGLSPAVYIRSRKLKVGAYSWPNVGQLLPLQIMPHAAPVDQYWTDHYKRRLSGDVVVELAHDYELNRKLLGELRPDFIVGIDSFVPEEEKELLARLAPVYFVPWEKDWRTQLRLVGQFLDRTAEAERWLDRFDERAAQAMALLECLRDGERLAVLMIHDNGLHRWAEERPDPCMNAPFPFAPNRMNGGTEGVFERATAREVAALEADRLLVLLSEDPGSIRVWRQLHNTPEWTGMKAVRDSRAHAIAAGPAFDYTAYNHGMILEQALRLLDELRQRHKRT